MKPTKEEKSEILFREIGTVPDRYLTDALQYRRSRTPRVAFSAVAAGILLVVGILFGARWMLTRLFPPGGETSVPEATDTRMENLLRSLDAGQCTPLSVHSDGRFSMTGEAYLVWQYAGEETFYRSRSFTETEVRTLCDALKKSGASVPGLSGEKQPFRVWLVLADGEVLTPYLPLTAGNVGRATLFDYRAERIPAEAFLEALCSVFGENP